MTITNGYITLAEYKTYGTARGQSASADTSDDAMIEALIEAASRYIERQTGRQFYKDSVAVARYFTASTAHYLSVFDLVSASEIKTDSDGSRSYSTTWASTDYDLEPYESAQLSKPYSRVYPTPQAVNFFPVGVRRGVKITGIWGWPSVPRDIWEACQTIVMSAYAARSGQASSGKLTITSAGLIIRPEEVPPKAQETFRIYRPLT